MMELEVRAVNSVENPPSGASVQKSAKSTQATLIVVRQTVPISVPIRGVMSAVPKACLNVMAYRAVVQKSLIASLVRLHLLKTP